MKPSPVENVQKYRLYGMRQTLTVSFAANLTMALVKVIYGYFTGSLAMSADGFHSLLDAGGSIIGLVGVTLAARPPDESHPYGYERYESLSSLAIGGFMVLAIFEIINGAVNRLVFPQLPEVTLLSYTFVGISIVTSAAVFRWENRRARRFSSDLIKADAWHTLSDSFVSIAVLVSLIGSYLHIRFLDPVIALGVAAALAWAAFMVLQRATHVLSDAASIDLEEIIRAAKQIEGVKDCHAARARGPAGHAIVDLHVLVDGNLSVFASHAIAEAVNENIKKMLPGIVDVLVHIGPIQEHYESEHRNEADL
jgi:cation diffusion facilitator family transporter